MKNYTLQILGLLLVMSLSSCATTTQKPAEELGGEQKAATNTEPAKAAAEPPPEVLAALVPPVRIDLSAPRAAKEHRYDISVNNVEARAFFMSLVKDTPENMIVNPEVKGKLSLNLNNVTTAEVMDLVREVYGYEYEKRGNNYIVMPRRLQSKMFHVNYLNLKRIGKSRTTVIGSQLTTNNQNSNQMGTQNYASPVTSGGDRTEITGGSQIRTESETDLWGGLVESIQHIIGDGEGRRVVATPQASLVMVRAMPAELREVQNYLKMMEGSLEKQVILEAKVLEVQLSTSFQAGINWAALATVNGNPILVGQTGGGTIFEGQTGLGSLYQNNMTTGIAGNEGNLSPGDALPDGTAVKAFGGVFTVAAQFSNFAAFLELLETQGDVNVLSSPRISTVNNQKAMIKVGHDEYYVTNVSSTTTSTVSTATSFPNVQLTPFFSGVALDVMPQIGEDGEITLHIHPSISDVQDDNKEIIIADQLLALPLASSDVRESDNIVHVRSGQMVVIGGLMSEIKQDLDGGVPFLKDIPGIGAAFKHKATNTRKTELVILLKPVLVDNGLKWDAVKGNYDASMRDMAQ